MVVAAAEGNTLSCNGMSTAGSLSPGNPLCQNLPRDDLLVGDVPLVGAAPAWGDALSLGGDLISDGALISRDALALEDVPVPRSDVSGVSLRASRAVRAAFLQTL